MRDRSAARSPTPQAFPETIRSDPQTAPTAEPFWRTKSLEAMSPAEWESL